MGTDIPEDGWWPPMVYSTNLVVGSRSFDLVMLVGWIVVVVGDYCIGVGPNAH